MADPQVTFEQREDFLLVTGHGERNNFAAIIDATSQINDVLVRLQKQYLLIDYREVKFNMPITNVFDVVRVYETKMPHLKKVFIAAILSKNNWDIGKYWKEIAQQRGFNFTVFEDFEQAEAWLSEQRANQTKAN
jgi:hypothetical protein